MQVYAKKLPLSPPTHSKALRTPTHAHYMPPPTAPATIALTQPAALAHENYQYHLLTLDAGVHPPPPSLAPTPSPSSCTSSVQSTALRCPKEAKAVVTCTWEHSQSLNALQEVVAVAKNKTRGNTLDRTPTTKLINLQLLVGIRRLRHYGAVSTTPTDAVSLGTENAPLPRHATPRHSTKSLWSPAEPVILPSHNTTTTMSTSRMSHCSIQSVTEITKEKWKKKTLKKTQQTHPPKPPNHNIK
ncbi:unnamed protein product [Mesocestoides corti]|uniref:Uncharacterized protein n=1 Tax=Mesocestoides corti TaxID=53468 RepID=A0A0R3UD92_MESCO|nr:unnamed protein product [Mesocestoides corti]